MLAAAGCTEGPPPEEEGGGTETAIDALPEAAQPPEPPAPEVEPPEVSDLPEIPLPTREGEVDSGVLPFEGLLIVRHGQRLVELVGEPGGGVARRPIGKLCGRCEEPAAVSPDGRYLLYSTPRATVLRDPGSGRERAVLPDPSSCLRFSPDGSRFAYVRDHLYVSDLEGSSQLVYEAPSAVYTVFTHVGSTGEGSRPLYGKVDCPVWLGSKRLVFQRFAGSMPLSLGEDTDEFGRSYFGELEPNGTSLATLDPGPALEHSSERIEVTAACKGGRYVLLRNLALLAPGLGGLEDLSPRRLFRNREVLASGFLPGTCRPYASTARGFKVFDPQTGKVSETFDVNAGGAEVYFDRRWQGVWVSDPAEMVAAVVGLSEDITGFEPSCPCSISLLRLETGDTRQLAVFPRSSRPESLQVVAWLPS